MYAVNRDSLFRHHAEDGPGSARSSTCSPPRAPGSCPDRMTIETGRIGGGGGVPAASFGSVYQVIVAAWSPRSAAGWTGRQAGSAVMRCVPVASGSRRSQGGECPVSRAVRVSI